MWFGPTSGLIICVPPAVCTRICTPRPCVCRKGEACLTDRLNGMWPTGPTPHAFSDFRSERGSGPRAKQICVFLFCSQPWVSGRVRGVAQVCRGVCDCTAMSRPATAAPQVARSTCGASACQGTGPTKCEVRRTAWKMNIPALDLVGHTRAFIRWNIVGPFLD